MKTIIFFNNKSGVGKTSMVYHVTWMLAELGHRCLAIDLDPQANLTSMFLQDDKMDIVYNQDINSETLLAGIQPLASGIGGIAPVTIHEIVPNIGLLAGDLGLMLLEDKINSSWSKCVDGDEASFRIVTAFHRIIHDEAVRFEADYCIIDVGPNFGALNRATLITSDYLVVPISTDQFSLQGLKDIGKCLRSWKTEWTERLGKNRSKDISLPNGLIKPLGYVVTQHGIHGKFPAFSYLKWANRIPAVFEEYFLNSAKSAAETVDNDMNCLALLKHYYSLVPMALEARKPIFLLKPADGAIGAHCQAVLKVYQDFKSLTYSILSRINKDINDIE